MNTQFNVVDFRDILNKMIVHGNSSSNKNDFKTMKQYASQGNPTAEYITGYCYLHGMGVDINIKKAFKWLNLSAIKNNHEAQFYMGFFLKNGIEVEKCDKKAKKILKKSIEKNYPPAQYLLASFYFEDTKKKYSYPFKAFNLYKQSAKQGYLPSHLYLFFCYEQGIGTNINKDKSYKHLTEASKGYIPGIYYLGLYFIRNIDPPNYERAINCWEECAIKNYSPAKYELAWYYLNISKEHSKFHLAIQILLESAKNGYDYAQCYLGYLYLCAERSNENILNAHLWLKKAAEQGDGQAIFYLGFCYEMGIGVIQNNDSAINLYKEALNKNYLPANDRLINLLPATEDVEMEFLEEFKIEISVDFSDPLFSEIDFEF